LFNTLPSGLQHLSKVNAVVVHKDKFVITGSDDGGVRMWSVDGREQTLQFLVMNQVCTVIL